MSKRRVGERRKRPESALAGVFGLLLPTVNETTARGNVGCPVQAGNCYRYTTTNTIVQVRPLISSLHRCKLRRKNDHNPGSREAHHRQNRQAHERSEDQLRYFLCV